AEVRLGVSNAKLDESWNALRGRESKTDLLIIKKEDVLDHLGGVTGDIGEKISFLLDGDEIPVAREKVFGILFRRKPPRIATPACRIELSGGDVLQGVSANWDGERFRVRLAAGPEVTLDRASVTTIDYATGKIRFLSTLEPRDVQYVPYFGKI